MMNRFTSRRFQNARIQTLAPLATAGCIRSTQRSAGDAFARGRLRSYLCSVIHRDWVGMASIRRSRHFFRGDRHLSSWALRGFNSLRSWRAVKQCYRPSSIGAEGDCTCMDG